MIIGGKSMNMDEYRMLSAEEVQKYLPFGRDKVYRLMKSKSFPSTKIGKQYFVSFKNLITWQESYKGKEFIL